MEQETLNSILVVPNLHNVDYVVDFCENLMVFKDKHIELFCDGPGGNITNLYMLLFYFKKFNITYDTYITCEACSANSFLFLTGKKRYMVKYAVMHLHDVQVTTTYNSTDVKFFKSQGLANKFFRELLNNINPKLIKYITNGKENYIPYDKCLKLGAANKLFEII